MKIEDEICRPILDESKIVSDLSSLQKIALQNNYRILEQIENIKEQRAVISQEKSNFLPTLKIKLQGIYDKELLEEDLTTNTYSGKLELKYNIFNGMIDTTRTEREKLFLKEAQAKLDVVSKSVLDEIAVAYDTYNTAKKQTIELKQFIEENRQIIDIYNDQFDAGTRNFIDVLNVEGDLYNSKITLINTEFNMYFSYYQILKATSSLETTVLKSQNQTCSETSGFNLDDTVKTDESIQEVLSEDLQENVTDTKDFVSQGIVLNKYALFLESYKDNSTANKALDTINSSIENNTKAKVITNSNGSYTLTFYDIDGLENAIALKNKYNSKYPYSYYIKKKN